MADEPLDQDAIERLIAEQAAAAAGDGEGHAGDAPIVDAELVAEDATADADAPPDELAATAEADPVEADDAPLAPADIEALIAAELGEAPAAAAPLPVVSEAAPVVEDVAFPDLPEVHAPLDDVADIDLLLDVPLQITVELGQARRTIRELLELGQGSILHLSRHAGEPVDVLVNGQHIARGEVVVIDENFGVRVTEVVTPAERLRTMAA